MFITGGQEINISLKDIMTYMELKNVNICIVIKFFIYRTKGKTVEHISPDLCGCFLNAVHFKHVITSRKTRNQPT